MSIDTKNLKMTPYEICESYRTAKEPNKQIHILAQLNCTNEDFIVEVLKENGEPLRKRPYHRPTKKEAPQKKAPDKAGEEMTIDAAHIKAGKLPESVTEAVQRRIDELNELIEDTRQVLETNIEKKEELEAFIKTYG